MDHTPRQRSRPPAGLCGLPGQCPFFPFLFLSPVSVLSLFLISFPVSLRTISMDHPAASRNIALWATVCQSNNRSDGNCYCALISRMSQTSRDESGGWIYANACPRRFAHGESVLLARFFVLLSLKRDIIIELRDKCTSGNDRLPIIRGLKSL